MDEVRRGQKEIHQAAGMNENSVTESGAGAGN